MSKSDAIAQLDFVADLFPHSVENNLLSTAERCLIVFFKHSNLSCQESLMRR